METRNTGIYGCYDSETIEVARVSVRVSVGVLLSN